MSLNFGYYSPTLKVDFDKTKHLSEPSIRRRRIEREKLIALEREQEEKERIELELAELRLEEERKKKEEEKQLKLERRKQREEKRRQLLILKIKERRKEEVNRKIALEERKLLIAQRKLESIRLLSELFERLKNITPEQVSAIFEDMKTDWTDLVLQENQSLEKTSSERTKLLDREAELRQRLVESYKNLHSEQSERLQMTRKNNNANIVQTACSEITSCDSDPSSSSNCSDSSASHRSSSCSDSSESTNSPKWRGEKDSEEDKSKHYFEKSHTYQSAGRQDYPYPHYNSSFRPFRGRRFNQSRRGAFPYRQHGWRGDEGSRNYHHPLPESDSNLQDYYEEVHEEYYKYFQKLAKQDDSKDKDLPSCSHESSSYRNSQSRSSSKSTKTDSKQPSSFKSKGNCKRLSSISEESQSELQNLPSFKRKLCKAGSESRSSVASGVSLESLPLTSSNSVSNINEKNIKVESVSSSKEKKSANKRSKSKKRHKKHKKHKAKDQELRP